MAQAGESVATEVEDNAPSVGAGFSPVLHPSGRGRHSAAAALAQGDLTKAPP